MQQNKPRIVMLCGPGRSSRIMFHGIASHVNVECVVLENKVPAGRMIRRRIRKLGIATTVGQLLFMAFNKIMSKRSKSRIRQLIERYQLDDGPITERLVRKVDSVNSDEVVRLLKETRPDAVVVNGTRIISKNVLGSIDAPFINTHMGITPRYRGVHGGYWALANDDAENCGVTVHLVDPGIDTGGVLYQDTIRVEAPDNFNTYPLHQIAKAIPLINAALDDVAHQRLEVSPGVEPSGLWSHPTLCQYVKHRIRSGVK